jgi:hypothetical protein
MSLLGLTTNHNYLLNESIYRGTVCLRLVLLDLSIMPNQAPLQPLVKVIADVDSLKAQRGMGSRAAGVLVGGVAGYF